MFTIAGGCEQALETGYVPRKLNASESERRAFYAPQYTPESQGSHDVGVAPNLGMQQR
jgi:hypothetical protein